MKPGKRRQKPYKKPDKRNWKDRFFKTVPMVDDSGQPIPQDPPLNKEGFFVKKPETTEKVYGNIIKKKKLY